MAARRCSTSRRRSRAPRRAPGSIPAAAAAAIAAACATRSASTSRRIARDGRRVGNPAEPLVRALRRARSGATRRGYVHWGATSQDVVDTAAMLVARRALDLLARGPRRRSRMRARRSPTATARRRWPAGRCCSRRCRRPSGSRPPAGSSACSRRADGSRLRARSARRSSSAAPPGRSRRSAEQGPEVLRLLAAELDLAEPVAALAHEPRAGRRARRRARRRSRRARQDRPRRRAAGADRGRRGRARAAGRAGAAPRRCRTSAIRSGAVLARACARRSPAHAAVLSGALAQEHERAAGAWQAEWPALAGCARADGRGRGVDSRRRSRGSRSTPPGCGATST